MKILITNDDGYFAKGLAALVEAMRPFGQITVVAPKYHQSGMSMAVTLGYRPIAVKQLSNSEQESWWYLDGTPASCVKFGLDNIMTDCKPDVVVCGVNHGSNAGTAALYSATLGAAQEAAVNGIPAIGVSLDNFSPEADFTCVKAIFPTLFRRIMDNLPETPGILFNINFPDLPPEQIKGIRMARLGNMHWEEEYQPFDPGIYEKKGIDKKSMGIFYTPEVEPGEDLYMMAGHPVDSPGNDDHSDHYLVKKGYVAVVAQHIDNTEYKEIERMKAAGIEAGFTV